MQGSKPYNEYEGDAAGAEKTRLVGDGDTVEGSVVGFGPVRRGRFDEEDRGITF